MSIKFGVHSYTLRSQFDTHLKNKKLQAVMAYRS